MPEIEHIDLRMEITNGSTEVFLVGDWPARTAFSEELLAGSDCLHVAGNEVVVVLANAVATYRRVYSAPCGVWVCDRVECRLN